MHKHTCLCFNMNYTRVFVNVQFTGKKKKKKNHAFIQYQCFLPATELKK